MHLLAHLDIWTSDGGKRELFLPSFPGAQDRKSPIAISIPVPYFIFLYTTSYYLASYVQGVISLLLVTGSTAPV